jgi:phosphoglycerol transferase MdoB-like AlkP superfamily enzyme
VVNGDKVDLNESFIKRISVSIVFSILLAILAHGVDSSRLSSRTVLRVIPVEYSTLALNTPFTLFESYVFRSPASSQKTNSEADVFNPIKRYVSQEPYRKVNVVILILESFSKEYMGYFNKRMNCTPFLDSLCRHGLVCTNAYANGRTTLEALPSILASLPSLDDRPFILSSAMQKPFESLPHIFNRARYNTSFFYGARNGNLGIDNFARAALFNKYIGLTDYNTDNKNNQDFDGHWGIYDEEFLQYFSKKLSSYQQPFFSCLLTLSSHSPFSIPEKHVMKFNSNREPHLNSIMYADYALKQFFKTASKEKWFDNTMFVLVGDHSSYPNSEYYTNEKGLFSIPIIYFSASDSSLTGTYHSITQQCDIMPSIVDYVHDSHSIYTFGNSIFDSSQHFAVMKNHDVLQLIDDESLIGVLDNSLVYAYNLKKDSLLNDNLIPTKSQLSGVSAEMQLKALARTFYNCMENSKFDVK